MSKLFRAIVATAVFFSAGCIITIVVAADAPAAADRTKLAAGLTPVAQLLQLMDTDKNGKISKEEFVKYMEAEFDYADKNKDGQLDPVELNNLVHRLTHPASMVPRVGK